MPDAYLGVWKRTLLRTPVVEDTTSQVYWMQTASWHADIRVPASRPDFSASALDQLTRGELLQLAKQQGFCGTTVVEGNICRWLRRHDFQPPSGANDVGRMVFDTPDRLFEYGVEADYFEIWERVPASAGPSTAEQWSAQPFCLRLATGSLFMLVRPRAITLPRSTSLIDFAAGKSDDALRAMLDFEISYGVQDAIHPGGRIALSTLPWKQGKALPEREGSAVQCGA